MTRKIYRVFGVAVLLLGALVQTYAQRKEITGTVKDGAGMPLPGVNIVLKGTTTGTSTDKDGIFQMQADADQILMVSFIGYKSQEVLVGNQTSFNIVLEDDLTTLSEVIVVGYGEQKKALNTGANLQVKGDDIQKLSTTNGLQALQGQAPGVQITSTSGQPGGGFRVIIRGAGTNQNPNPLYVVDGVLTGDISFLNPADIQSIDVLKDAASAAIYGSQAGNGVILITTRKGNTNKAQITLDTYYGVQNIARKVPMLNAYQYAVIINEAAVNSGKAPYFSDTEMQNIKSGNTAWESAPNKMGLGADQVAAMKNGTNWMNEMFANDVPTSNVVLGISGGNDASRYSTSLSYLSQGGIIGGSDISDYKRYNFRFNSDHKLYNDRVRFGQTLNFASVNSRGIRDGGQYFNSVRPAFGASPFLPVYDAEGNFWNNTDSRWVPTETNPYASMVYSNQNRNNNTRIVGNVYLEVEPIKNLKVRSQIGFEGFVSESRSFNPVYELSVFSRNDTTSVSQSMDKGRTLIWDNLASYAMNFGEHHLDVMVGSAVYQGRGSNISGSNYNLVFDNLRNAWLTNSQNLTKGEKMTLRGAPYNDDNRLSYFGRVHYNFKERYLFNATLRRDGSSKFAEGVRWGVFPSVSAGWVISEEAFMESTTSFMDQLKLRASWGQVGSQNSDYFTFISPIKFQSTNYPFGVGEGVLTPGSYASRIANPSLHWETSEQIDLGFDAMFLQGKLTASFDWYKKTTKDWLVVAPIVATAGADAPFINGGNVTNNGVELALSYSSNVGALRYTVSANGAYNKNKVNEIPTADGIIHGDGNVLYANSAEFNRVQEGFPIGYFWGWKTDGIFQNQDEVEAHTNNEGNLLQPSAQPGDVRYVDHNKDGVINGNDKTMIGNPNPDFTFGFNIQLNYKALDFSLVGSGVAGNQIVQSYREQASSFSNYTTAILDRWHGEGTSNKMPRVNESNTNWVNFSDLFVQDGDFLRISNVTLGYDFSKHLKIKAFSQLRLYTSVLNAFTFTKYTGMDPEIGHGYNNWTTGVDIGYYPRPRIYMIGLNVKF